VKARALHPLVIQTASNALSCTSLGITIWFCSEMLSGHTAFHTQDYRVKIQTTNNLAQGLLLMRQSPPTKKKEKWQEIMGREALK